MNISRLLRLSLLALPLACGALAGPIELGYQGQLYTNGVPITGTQVFHFAMVTNNAVAWQSGAMITTYVEKALFSVRLGDTNRMNAVPASLLDGTLDVFLRVHVAALGGTTNLLSPDKKIVSAASAFDALFLGGKLPDAYMRKWTNVVIAGPGGAAGGADDNSVANAVSLAGARASSNNPCTVLLLPGVYTGGCSLPNYVNIVGLDRDGCIIDGKVLVGHAAYLKSFTVRQTGVLPGIDIYTNNSVSGEAFLENIRIVGGSYGINLEVPATMHNIEAVGSSNAAVRDVGGGTIDGLRTRQCTAFDVDLTHGTIKYNNIIAESEPGMVGWLRKAAGSLTALHGTRELRIDRCVDKLDVRDIDISASTSPALSIGAVDDNVVLSIYDGYLAAGQPYAVVISNTSPGTIWFDDVRIDALPSAVCVYIHEAPKTYFKGCELFTDPNAAGVGIVSVTGRYLYVQTTWIRAGTTGIMLAAPDTELFLYDTTVLTSPFPASSAISGYVNITVTGAAPRIADCRFETDTVPSQNVMWPGWNAFGGPGAVGAQEDGNGNIVMPMALGARPVSP